MPETMILTRECFEDARGHGVVHWVVSDGLENIEFYGSEQAAKAAYPSDTIWIKSRECLCIHIGEQEHCHLYSE